jgi:hypothetical protein
MEEFILYEKMARINKRGKGYGQEKTMDDFDIYGLSFSKFAFLGICHL